MSTKSTATSNIKICRHYFFDFINYIPANKILKKRKTLRKYLNTFKQTLNDQQQNQFDNIFLENTNFDILLKQTRRK